MNTQAALDSCLERIQAHAYHIGSLDLAFGADTAEALDEARRLQGTLRMFQRLLQRLEDEPALAAAHPLLRQAA